MFGQLHDDLHNIYGNFMLVDHHYSILHVYVPLGINLSRSRLDLSDSFFSILEIVLRFNVFYNCILVWGCAFLKQYCSHAAGLAEIFSPADRHC